MLDLIRYKVKDETVFGIMYDNSFGFGAYFTLERKSKLIPDGAYKLDLTYSPKFKCNLPIISNHQVPASRGIRIHAGNTAADSQGCILIGNTASLTTMSIGESQKALEQLVKVIEEWKKQDRCPTLYIKSEI